MHVHLLCTYTWCSAAPAHLLLTCTCVFIAGVCRTFVRVTVIYLLGEWMEETGQGVQLGVCGADSCQ